MSTHDVNQECAERMAHLEDIAESYKIHKEESKAIRDTVIKHDEALKNICELKRWWAGAVFTIAMALISMAVMWGSLLNRVDNLEKYSKFIMEHSYGVQDWKRSNGTATIQK